MAKSQQFVTAAVVADWLNLSTRRVRELAASGVIVKQGRDRYDLKGSVRSYATHVREQAAGRVGIDPATDITAVNMRVKEAAARLADLRYQKEAGTLIERAALHALWDPLVLGFRARALSWPSKAMFVVPTLTATDRKALETMTRDDLTDASLGRGFDFSGVATAAEIDDAIRVRDEGKKNGE